MNISPRFTLAFALVAFVFTNSLAQTAPAEKPSTPAHTASAPADDLSTPESTVAAVYSAISGPAGERNWARLRNICLPEVHFIVTGVDKEGKAFHRVLTIDDYQQRATPVLMKEGFYEHGIASRTVRYGHIAHVFTTYESRHEPDARPFARGINSMQLLSDGHRWYIVNILWDSETPDQPIPAEFLH
ncbi:MAG TPA: hypothetical protein VMU24_03490 [Candidatus Acidoferrales bacterium]|nr:hypothetical protein [Candidatus Acidoferrales bacterium]